MATPSTPRERFEPPTVSIRLLRDAHGLTIPALAKRIEETQGISVSPDHISNVELGWKRPSNALMTAWAKALGISRLDVRIDERSDAGSVSA